MKTRDIGQWMLSEHERMRELADGLRAQINAMPRGNRAGWLPELQQGFQHYRMHALRNMELEEEGGYLAPVLEQRATLAKQVHALQSEHGQLARLMEEIQRSLDQAQPGDSLILRDLCTRMQILLSHIDRHKEHECHLALYAFTQDIGTKD